MDARRVVLAVAVLVGMAGVSLLLLPPIGIDDPGTYNHTPVTIVDANGTVLATVDARIADTQEKRVTGLRNTEKLPDGEGMLFVHDADGRKPYIMPPEMSVALDIIFIAPDGTIRKIEHAPLPESGETDRYPGRAQYVLEVPFGYTNRTGIDPGDRVQLPDL